MTIFQRISIAIYHSATVVILSGALLKGCLWICDMVEQAQKKQVIVMVAHFVCFLLGVIGVVLTRCLRFLEPYLFLLAVGILLYRHRKITAGDMGTHSSIPISGLTIVDDEPITETSEDLLSRTAYVETVGNIVMAAPGGGLTQHATYVGIYGQWGEGKTTVRQLLEGHLHAQHGKDTVIFVDFSPWKYPEGTDLRLELCRKIAEAIEALPVTSRSKPLFKHLVKYANYKRTDGKWGAVNEFFDIFRDFWFSKVWPESKLFKAIKDGLVEIGKTTRIVVVVDDLDRVTPSEAAKVIRFLKANGDWPNLVYLILADEEYLAKAVGGVILDATEDKVGEGREYLQKIVPLACPLPAVPKERIGQYFEKGVESLIADYGLLKGHLPEAIAWSATYLKNLRDAKRIINAYSVVLARRKTLVDGKPFLGVDVGDLLVVTVLQQYEPELYKHLRAGGGKLFALCSQGQKLMGNSGVDDSWLDAYFYQYVKKENHEPIRAFLENWVGLVLIKSTPGNDAKNLYELENPDSPKHMTDFRLASRFSFDAYFQEGNEESRVAQEDVEEFKQQVNQQQFPARILEKNDEQQNLHHFLYALKGLDVWNTWGAAEFFMRTLIKMGGMNWRSVPNEQSEFDDNIYDRIYECLSLHCIRLCEASSSRQLLPPTQTVADSLISLLEEEKDVVMTAHFIASHGPAHVHDKDGRTGDNLFSVDAFKRLQDGYLKRILDCQVQGKMMSHPDCRTLLSSWISILVKNGNEKAKKGFQAVFLRELRNPDSAWKVLTFFGSWAPEFEESGVRLVNLDSLERVFGADGVKQIADTLESLSGPGDMQGRTIDLLKWMLDAKSRGERYDETAQTAYLERQNQKEKRDLNTNLSQGETSSDEHVMDKWNDRGTEIQRG